MYELLLEKEIKEQEIQEELVQELDKRGHIKVY